MSEEAMLFVEKMCGLDVKTVSMNVAQNGMRPPANAMLPSPTTQPKSIQIDGTSDNKSSTQLLLRSHPWNRLCR